MHTNYIISDCTTLQYIHNIWHGIRYLGRNKIFSTKNNEFNSAAIFPVWHELPRLRRARLTWPTYGDGRKLENSSVWKDRIIVASTCRRSVQFGCYITWLCMANCVSVTTKLLRLFNFTIPCHARRAWKTSRCARALAGSRVWLVESILFRDHVSLCLHWEFSLKFNLFN